MKKGINSLRALRFGTPSIFVTALCAYVALLTPGSAQTAKSLPDLSAVLQQMQQNQGETSSPSERQPQALTLPVQNYHPVSTPPSRIELILSKRANLPLWQFGYDVFSGLSQISIPQVGSVQGYYVLGPGDELHINLRGQENASYDVIVGNDGNITLPKLAPIRAAGRTFSDFQASLDAAVKQAYVATSAYVSVGQFRQVRVTVAGEVNAPGVKLATGMSSPLDALILAMGVKKSGSLRNIRILRGGRTIPYDLYHVLLNDGSASPVLLADGDRIVVPTLGKVAAVSGWVRRPGIYELAPGQSSIPVKELLRLGGGLQVRGSFRYSLQTIDSEGRQMLNALSSPAGRAQDGDILFVEQAVSAQVGRFEFFGPTNLAGGYSLSSYRNLSDLLRAPGAMGESPYMLLGMISRKDPKSLQRRVIAFSPADVRARSNDIPLQSEDIVRIFDRREAALMTNAVNIYAKQIDFLGVAAKPDANDTAATATSAAMKEAVNAAIFAKATDESVSRYTAQSPSTERWASASLAAMAGKGAGGSAGMAGPSTQFSDQNGTGNPYGNVGRDNPNAPYGSNVTSMQHLGSVRGDAALDENKLIQEATAGPFTLDQRTSSQGNVPVTGELENVAGLGQQIGIDPIVLISFLADHRVTLNGAVRGPGTYLVGDSITLDELVEAAGGPLKWTDLSQVLLSHTEVDPASGRSKTQQLTVPITGKNLAAIPVQLRDVFRFNPVYTNVDRGTVVVQGEVRFPGAFDITRGERLSELLQQAGGLTSEAYPYGAIFLRKSAAALQKVGYERSAEDIEKQLTMAVAEGSNSVTTGPTAEAAGFLQGLVAQLHNTQPPGRVTVVADPATLATHPEDDVVLQPGDFLYIPQRPSSVTVVGEVLNPGSYPQTADRTVDDYIELAGGYGRYADTSYVYVINPDGSSRPVQSSLFHFGSDRLPPGSLVVVPRDLRPFDARQFAVIITKIFSDLALSAASISVVANN
jgi:protein involved in polysaccharide export with SLBB domain